MSPPLPPTFRAAAALLLACVGCGNLGANQAAVSGGPGPVVAVGGSSGGARSGSPVGGGGGQGGAGGAACLGPGASAACTTCEATMCTTNAFIYGEGYDAANYDPGTAPFSPGLGIDWYHRCYNATGTAPDGPMAGAKNSDLCAAVVECVHASGCDAHDTANLPCYCGAGVSAEDCAAPNFIPTGPCKDQIAYASYTTDFLTIAMRATDYAFPSGAGLGLVFTCDYPVIQTELGPGLCGSECLGNPDGGTGCGAGSPDGGPPTDGSVARADGGGGQAGAGGGAGAGGSGGGCSVTYSFADANACASCETTSGNDYCTPTLLTATLTEDDSGNAVPVGFGPDTLATAAQRDAAFALIHRVLALQCYSDSNVKYRPADKPGCQTLEEGPCVYANYGCLLDLGQLPTDVGSGIFAQSPTYSAVAEYEAAAIADATAGPASPDPFVGYGAPGGISAGASNAALGSYISIQAGHPSSAIGIADTVLTCAVAAACSACFNLTATTTCPDGGPASTGAGGGSSGTGGSGGGGTGENTGGIGGHAGAAGAGGPACPDLDADGVPDCKETLLQNPGFDSATTGWTAEPRSSASWASQDAAGNPSSGALAVVNSDTNTADAPYGTTTAGATQCIGVTSGDCYQVDAQTSIPAGQASVATGFVLDEHPTGDCSQPPVTSFVSPQISNTGGWQTIAGTTTRIPLGVGSVAVRLVAVKPVAQASAEALFDNVLVRLTACASP